MTTRWITCALLMLAMSCDGGGEPDAGTDALADRKREVLASLGANVILPTYRDFAASAAALEAATATLASDPSEANRTAAQDAWVAAIAIWQRAEMFPIGIAGMSGTQGVVGGMDLGDEIYSFPNTITCRIDQETTEQAYLDPDAFRAERVDVRGLDSLEYLLFAPTAANTCEATHAINAEGTWAALGDAEVSARRAAYAHTLAVLVKRHADALVSAWEPDEGNFLGALSTAGEGGSPFRSAQHGLNDLAGQLIAYADAMMKDMKIGEPAGILRCPATTCLDQLESPWAHRSKEHVLVNLRSLETLVLGAPPGTEALGIDDLLIEIGAGETAAELVSAIEGAIAAVEALEGDLTTAIETDRAGVMAAFDAMTTAVTLLKSDLVTLLDVELPANFGDND